ncbi:MAG: GNAT family N-acyltransferase [Verrucomicrobiales bacterium]|nr:GNAT family N-acyltransferase [Verrucomicrobiales bacterium]
MNTLLEAPRLVTNTAAYAVRLAADAEEVRAAQRLRFNVFNLELNEGLATSFATGVDADEFDAVCDHLIVTENATGAVVGTYRMQTGRMAARGRGYYSAGEFDLTPLEPLRDEMVELGRACVARAHRNLVVLGLLWKGIADYTTERGGRYLIGCSSLTSQDPAVGATVYADLCRRHLAPPSWRIRPLPHCECPLRELTDEAVALPKLLRAYLSLGAKICGPPALDRQFGTIDFLTLLDLVALSPQTRARFFGS